MNLLALSDRLKLLFTSLNRHHVFTVSSGAVGAQVLSLLFMPVLSRLYSIEAFGYFAIYLAGSNLIGTFSTLRFEIVIPLAETDQDALRLSTLSCVNALLIGLIFALFFAFPQTRSWVPSMFQDYLPWFLMILSAVFIGWSQTFTQRLLRNGNIKMMAVRVMADRLSFIGFALLAGFWGHFDFGLMWAQSIGVVVGAITLFVGAWWCPQFNGLIFVWRKFSVLQRSSLASMFLQLTGQQGTTLLYSVLFPVQSLGFYNLAQRLAEAPVNLVSSALGTAYYRRLLAADPPSLLRIYRRTMLWSLLIFVFPGIAVASLAHWLIPILFGQKWEASVGYFLVLLPLAVIRLIFMLQQGIVLRLQRLDLDMKFSFFVLLSQIIGILLGLSYNQTLIAALAGVSVVGSVTYVICLRIIYRLARAQRDQGLINPL